MIAKCRRRHAAPATARRTSRAACDRAWLRRLPPLHALRAFEAAARHLSFKGAAEELAVSPTAISHHVRQLEAALGVRLFERHSRRVELTAHGNQLYPVLREGFDAFAHAIENLRTQRLRRVVTLSATVAFTARWLLPRVGALRRKYRHLDLRLHASDDPVDLHRGKPGDHRCDRRTWRRAREPAARGDELARGTLVQPFGPTLPGYGYSLVYREDAAQAEHIVALRDWIRAELGGYSG